MVPFCPVRDRFWLTEEPYIIFVLQDYWDITKNNLIATLFALDRVETEYVSGWLARD